MKQSLLGMLVLGCALPAMLRAQDLPAPPQTPAVQERPAAGAAPEAGTASAQPPRSGAGDERFKPSEEISEDLSVSFPSDI